MLIVIGEGFKLNHFVLNINLNSYVGNQIF